MEGRRLEAQLELLWRRLSRRLGLPVGLASEWWDVLRSAYTSEGRYYHTLHHLEELFDHCDGCATDVRQLDCVHLAIWFHDVVYDARGEGGGRNERESAALFLKFAREAQEHIPPALAQRVAEWIEMTWQHRCTPADPLDCRLFMDMDMAILGQRPPRYDEYARQVRAEYAHVPWPVYCYYRARFLIETAGGPPVFQTPQFARLEGTAQQNMRREAWRLRRSLVFIGLQTVALLACLFGILFSIQVARYVGGVILVLGGIWWLLFERAWCYPRIRASQT